mmetsp:Transcript_53676/g.165110  ORF Transcript_53676/g.165110 Transcript_53676/m.165110 type:complete len:381 (+) Transcript_53676:88-1230(+)
MLPQQVNRGVGDLRHADEGDVPQRRDLGQRRHAEVPHGLRADSGSRAVPKAREGHALQRTLRFEVDETFAAGVRATKQRDVAEGAATREAGDALVRQLVRALDVQVLKLCEHRDARAAVVGQAFRLARQLHVRLLLRLGFDGLLSVLSGAECAMPHGQLPQRRVALGERGEGHALQPRRGHQRELFEVRQHREGDDAQVVDARGFGRGVCDVEHPQRPHVRGEALEELLPGFRHGQSKHLQHAGTNARPCHLQRAGGGWSGEAGAFTQLPHQRLVNPDAALRLAQDVRQRGAEPLEHLPAPWRVGQLAPHLHGRNRREHARDRPCFDVPVRCRGVDFPAFRHRLRNNTAAKAQDRQPLVVRRLDVEKWFQQAVGFEVAVG